MCAKNVEELRTEALTALYRQEEEFRNVVWYFRKYQEMVYDPLWQAVIMRKDTFSKERKAEGEVLYQRYRLLADQTRLRGSNALEAVMGALEKIEKGLVHETVCDGAVLQGKSSENISQFNLCMGIWNHETEDKIGKLRKLITRYKKKEEEFSELVESSLTNNPSDHDTFEDRYKDYFFETDSKTQIAFLRLSREIKERFEHTWPAERCCQVCGADQKTQWDPVLSQLKLDPQGAVGAAGQIVNNARLLPAFKAMEEKEKKHLAEKNEA